MSGPGVYDDGNEEEEAAEAEHLMEASGELQSFASSRSATKRIKMSDATLRKIKYPLRCPEEKNEEDFGFGTRDVALLVFGAVPGLEATYTPKS